MASLRGALVIDRCGTGETGNGRLGSPRARRLRPARRALTFALAFAAASLASRVAAGGPASEGAYHRMKKAVVIDQHGFEKPMPALSLLIPSDWTFEGALVYPKGMPCGELVKFQFRAQSPDGKLAVELFPAYVWQWVDDPNSRRLLEASNQQGQRFGKAGCDLLQPMGAANFVSKLLAPKVRPGSHVLGVEPLQEVNESLKRQVQQAQAQADQVGLKVRISADAARAKVAYQAKGASVEEWLSAVVTVRAQPMPTFSGGRMGHTTSYSEQARFLFGMRAPAGQLAAHEKLFRLIVSSLRVEPDWQSRMTQVQMNIAAIQQKGEADRAKIRQQTAQDIQRIQNESFQNRQHAMDVQAEKFSQVLRGVETYRDPGSGEKVELSNQYGHAWTNGTGDYILSDSPNFNPNEHKELKGDWRQMQHVEPR
ncbi:MAG TPA: hypothetical protein VMT17_14380 [Anaeromyxobacteraceae bacterium]|nr:hypothetical protein [Anaeromyxobacteraceae bacterium]